MAPKTTYEINIKQTEDWNHKDKIDKLFGDAFSLDPAFIWLYPNEANVKTPYLTNVFFNLGVIHKQMYVADDNILGCAVWIPPGKDISITDLYKIGFFRSLWKLGLGGAYRTLKIFLKNEKYKKQHVPGKSWYLLTLVVDESFRGKGIGEKILKPVFDQADKEGVICYAESSNKKNLNFYKRVGFEVIYEEKITDSPEAPPVFYIKREPKKRVP